MFVRYCFNKGSNLVYRHAKGRLVYNRRLHVGAGPLLKPMLCENGYNLNVTDRAKKRLQMINDDSGEWLRVNVENGGCHGYQYNLSLIRNDCTDKENKDKLSIKKDGVEKNEFEIAIPDIAFNITPKVKILIDEQSMKILNNTTLEYTQELIGSSFQITGGNLKSKCGCGTSFDLDTE